MTKKIIIIAALVILSITLVGCDKKEEPTNDSKNTNISNETEENTVNEEDDLKLPEGTYKVEKDDNTVYVISNVVGVESTTKYIYENNELNRIETIQEYVSEEMAKYTYDAMMEEELNLEEYSEIKLDGKTIKLNMKLDYLEQLKTISIDQMYETQKAAYGIN